MRPFETEQFVEARYERSCVSVPQGGNIRAKPISSRYVVIIVDDARAGPKFHRRTNRQLKDQLPTAFKTIKRLGLSIAGAYFNADSGFDTREARTVCFNHHVIPHIAENKRNRKSVKLGRKCLFNAAVYTDRLASERTFAWIDKFRVLVVRFDLKKTYFMGSHFLPFTLFNLRNVFV